MKSIFLFGLSAFFISLFGSSLVQACPGAGCPALPNLKVLEIRIASAEVQVIIETSNPTHASANVPLTITNTSVTPNVSVTNYWPLQYSGQSGYTFTLANLNMAACPSNKTYHLTATVDANNTIAETSETDNSLSLTVGCPCVAPAVWDPNLKYCTCSGNNAYNPYTNKCEAIRSDGCVCIPGYWYASPGSKYCTKSATTPLKTLNHTAITLGDTSSSYLPTGSSFDMCQIDTRYDDANWPFTSFDIHLSGGGFCSAHDSISGSLVIQSSPISAFWTNRVQGSQRIGIKNLGPLNNWYSKSFCVNVPNSADYTLFVGGDNHFRVVIDGKEFANCTNDWDCSLSGYFYLASLTQGAHVLELRYENITDTMGGSTPGALWAELYTNPWTSAGGQIGLTSVTTESQLNRIFSTKGLAGTASWDYTGDGTACPAGQVLDACGGSGKCLPTPYITQCSYP